MRGASPVEMHAHMAGRRRRSRRPSTSATPSPPTATRNRSALAADSHVQPPRMHSQVAPRVHRCDALAVESVKGWLTRRGWLAPRARFDLALVEAFSAASFAELDYRREAENARRFARDLVRDS